MKVFVSYARRDNDEAGLWEIDRLVRNLLPGSTPYIDDLHHDPHHDRHEGVELAFKTSVAFVAIKSPWYRRTYWTDMEYQWAVEDGIPIYEISKQDLTALAA
jgi:hypothetical protein